MDAEQTAPRPDDVRSKLKGKRVQGRERQETEHG